MTGKFVHQPGEVINGFQFIEYLYRGIWITECQACHEKFKRPACEFKKKLCPVCFPVKDRKRGVKSVLQVQP